MRTPGFAGADLANLVNEAALLAARRDHETMAYHEVGHTIEKLNSLSIVLIRSLASSWSIINHYCGRLPKF
jgi:ATP-dependent 26S proteasome regulatory subunit